MAVDPNSTAAAATPSPSAPTTIPAAAATVAPSRPLTSPPPLSSRPVSQPSHLQIHNSHLYPSHQPFYAAQSLPIRAQNPHSASQLPKTHDPVTQGILYPVASSGRGFIPKSVRSLSSDQMVTVANPGVYHPPPPPPPSLMFPHSVRSMGSPHLDYLNYSLHMTRPHSLQYPHLGLVGGAGSASASGSVPIKGVPVPAHTKVAPRSTNGHRDTRERSRDDAFTVVRDRKVKLTEDSSLYALCRSWMRNGGYEENQPQQEDVIKALPRPLPASVVATYMANNKEDGDGDKQEEDEKPDEQLTPQDLLKRHIRRAKKVRARLREERLQRITRYRSRLRLLLPPSVEQFRNDLAAGN